MSDITEYLRKQREDGLFYSWPDFWHLFGNKFPLKDYDSHKWHLAHLLSSVIADNRFIKSQRFCAYCALEFLGNDIWFSDDGVRASIPDSG